MEMTPDTLCSRLCSRCEVRHARWVFLWLAYLASALTARSEDEVLPKPDHKTKDGRTLAVLSVDGGVSQGIADLVMSQLQSNSSLSFVEREQFKSISDEQAMALAGSQTAGRVKVGKLVGADLLVLVGRQNSPDGEMIRLLVCDCATGARIGQVRMSAKNEKMDPLVHAVQRALARFPDKVESVVTVSDFISRDLGFEYSHLQKDLAELLRQALSRHKGLAVVEIDEARSIGTEVSRSGGDVSRVVPLAVVGEYRTDRFAKGGPQISIKVSLNRGKEELVQLTSGSILIHNAGQFVVKEVHDKMLELLHQSDAVNVSPDTHFARLVKRADQFAEIGDLERAAALREAALLLHPGDDAQRVRLVREYAAWNLHPVDIWPKGAMRTLQDPFWIRVVARARENWIRSLFHIEYLVRNRRVTMEVGTELFGATIRSARRLQSSPGQVIREEEQRKKEFIRNVAPVLFKLEGHKYKSTTEQFRERAAYCIMEEAFYRIDGKSLTGDDLDLVGDLLCKLLPEDMPCPMVLLYRLRSGASLLGRPERSEANDEWVRFATRLKESDRPLVKAYGEYALLCHRHYREKDISDALLADARQLVASLSDGILKRRDTRERLRGVASSEATWIRMALERKRPREVKQPPSPQVPPSPKSAVPQIGPKMQSDGTLVCDRIRLRPMEIALALGDGKRVSLNGHRWRGAGGYGGWMGLVPAWNGTDVFYASGAVVFVNENRVAREVLFGEDLSIHCVVFDGKYIWVAGGYDRGIYVISEAGKIVAHMTPDHGLPKAHVVMPVHVLELGKIMAAGSIGPHGRGWLATVSFDGNEPHVNVFHEAVKVWDYRDTPMEMRLDPAMRFRPYWIIEHHDTAGNRWIFVDRYRSPLVVNAKTLQVSVYPLDGELYSFPRRERPASAFLSHGGQFYVAGSRGDFKVFRLDPTTRRFAESEKRNYEETWHSGTTSGRLVLHEGHLIYAGERRWLRRNLKTGREEILIAEPRALPHYGRGAWTLCVSRCFGLLACRERNIYQMSFEE